ncbi:MAG: family 10 glycosylhydrolase [Rikenellaceae bacterium]
MINFFSLLKKTFIYLIVIPFLLVSCSKNGLEPDGSDKPTDPELSKEFNITTDKVILRHEFRAAWLTTVGNYDWPPKNVSGDVQKEALISIIDRLKNMNINVVLFHVRPTSDAFYHSQLVPWSGYLTGTQGEYPGFDPLAVAIQAAHERGMELHAWLNPYRIGSTSIALASNHPVILHPEWCVVFENNRYLNPGIPEVKAHLLAVVKEIIDNYDVDGIHFDDYFYPSGAKSTTDPFKFNDKATFEQYGETLDIHAWREKNVNEMVRDVSQIIKNINPKVVFGISPMGKQENSMTVYANALSWIQNKWLDYLAPQIYWEIGHATADFNTVIRYWNINSGGTPIIPGLAAYKYGDSNYPAYTLQELLNQVSLGRSLNNISGNCWFRVNYILSNTLGTYIKNSIYPSQSLIPKLGTYNEAVPGYPVVSIYQKNISWNFIPEATQYAVYELVRDGKTVNWNAMARQISNATSFVANSAKNYIVIAINGKEKSTYERVVYVP